ncbi:hypothetical protein ACFV2Z_40020 [Streptomyces sp. NPDC059688]|uniref:hypothetical protein n=1 Tax=Streptomyces sp. NPDC059688 TaxID=3346906 RepID=UPI0036BF7BF1
MPDAGTYTSTSDVASDLGFGMACFDETGKQTSQASFTANYHQGPFKEAFSSLVTLQTDNVHSGGFRAPASSKYSSSISGGAKYARTSQGFYTVVVPWGGQNGFGNAAVTPVLDVPAASYALDHAMIPSSRTCAIIGHKQNVNSVIGNADELTISCTDSSGQPVDTAFNLTDQVNYNLLGDRSLSNVFFNANPPASSAATTLGVSGPLNQWKGVNGKIEVNRLGSGKYEVHLENQQKLALSPTVISTATKSKVHCNTDLGRATSVDRVVSVSCKDWDGTLVDSGFEFQLIGKAS